MISSPTVSVYAQCLEIPFFFWVFVPPVHLTHRHHHLSASPRLSSVVLLVGISVSRGGRRRRLVVHLVVVASWAAAAAATATATILASLASAAAATTAASGAAVAGLTSAAATAAAVAPAVPISSATTAASAATAASSSTTATTTTASPGFLDSDDGLVVLVPELGVVQLAECVIHVVPVGEVDLASHPVTVGENFRVGHVPRRPHVILQVLPRRGRGKVLDDHLKLRAARGTTPSGGRTSAATPIVEPTAPAVTTTVAAATTASDFHAQAFAVEFGPVSAPDSVRGVARIVEFDERKAGRTRRELEVNLANPSVLVEQVLDLALADVERQVAAEHDASLRTSHVAVWKSGRRWDAMRWDGMGWDGLGWRGENENQREKLSGGGFFLFL